MRASNFTPLDKLRNFMKDGSMNNQYGIQFFAIAEPERQQGHCLRPLN